ncbi:MAG: carbohydrate ABC transporter permease [Spirochaetia bacterium]
MPTRQRRSVLLTIIGCAIVIAMLFPLYWAFAGSLKTNNQIFAIPPTFLPTTPTFDSYEDAFAAQWRALVTSIIVSAGTVLLSLVVATPAAYALAHFKFHATTVLVTCLLLAQMIPPVVLANSLYVIFNRVGLLNSYVGLIAGDSSLAIPFSVLILRAYMQSIPPELPEAAYVDGAGDLEGFLRIVLPISRSAIITAALFAFLFAWGDFLFALTLLTKPGIQPITLSLYRFFGIFLTAWNRAMATAVITSIPAALLLVLAQRFITAGLTAGSLKG